MPAIWPWPSSSGVGRGCVHDLATDPDRCVVARDSTLAPNPQAVAAFKRLTPATKRCSVCDSTPLGIMISIS